MKETESAQAGSGSSLIHAALRNLGWLLASRGVLALLSLVYLGLATRTLGVRDFGRFALVTGAAQALVLFVGFQTWQVVVWYGVEHLRCGDRAALGRLYRACILLDATSAVVGIALTVAILVFFGDAMGIEGSMMGDTVIFAVAQIITVRSAAVGILRLSSRFRESATADSVTPVVRLTGAVIATIFYPTLQAFLVTWAVAEVATAAAYWWLLAKNGDLKIIREGPVALDALLRENPQLFGFLVNTNISSTLGLASKHVPLLFVGGFVGPAAAGGFRLAIQLAQALVKFSQLLSRAAFPELVRAMRQARSATMARSLRRGFVASGAAGLAILGLIALTGRPLLTAVGGDPRYAAAYPLLVWMVAAGAIDLAVVTFEPVLMAAHRSTAAMVSRIVGAAVQMATMIVLLPVMAAEGASIGVFAGSLVSAVLLSLSVARLLRR